MEKGHDRLIAQFAQVSRVGDQLIIVGGGPEEAHLRSTARRWGVADRVLFTGQILNPYPVMALADAVLLLSRWEGQGLILLEAMILGVPVVSTDIPGPGAC